MSFENTNSAMRGALQSHLAAMRGATNRVWAWDHSNRIRGSFPSTELFSNNTFLSGTTSWSAQQSTISVADRVMRVTVAKNIASGASAFYSTANPTVTQYVPYVLRGFLGSRSKTGLSAGTYTNGTTNYSTDASGLITQLVIPTTTSLGSTYPTVYDTGESVTLTGDWIECPFASLSRCALVDNGQNYLLQSDDFTTTWANVRTTDSGNADTDPLGSSTADRIIEDASASTTHYIEQTGLTVSSAAAEFCFAVALKAGTRTWAQIVLIEDTGSTGVSTYVNLSTGALGTLGSGANFANPRAFSRDLGDGWYYVAIVGSKTNAATALRARILLATADATNSYTGDGSSYIRAWRGTVSQSSVPTRLVQTTTTAIASGTSQALTGGLYTKGWPVSTNGLLLPGDQVQIGNQLLIVTSAVNSDAAGLAFLQTAPALRSAPADNTPIIINQPMGKFFLEADSLGWSNKPGIVSDTEVILSEAA